MSIRQIHSALRKHEMEMQKGYKVATRLDKRTTRRLLAHMEQEGQVEVESGGSNDSNLVRLSTAAEERAKMDATEAATDENIRERNSGTTTSVEIAPSTTTAPGSAVSPVAPPSAIYTHQLLRKRFLNLMSKISTDDALSELATPPPEALNHLLDELRYEKCGAVVACMRLHFHLLQVVRDKVSAIGTGSMLQPVHVQPIVLLSKIPAAFYLQCFRFTGAQSWLVPAAGESPAQSRYPTQRVQRAVSFLFSTVFRCASPVFC